MNLDKEVFDIALGDIIPNRFQPREVFDDQALAELAQSIKEHGVIQPIIVRKVGDKYEIVAGERRFRASQMAGKETIPALVKNLDDKETAKIALLENLQRKDLTPIEEAKTYQTILKLDNLTQEELANNLGKAQSTVANKLRLLNLDESVQTALLNEKISERHARSLLNIEDKMKQKELLDKVILNRMTVRQLDQEISIITGKPLPVSEEEGGTTGGQSPVIEPINPTPIETSTVPETESISQITPVNLNELLGTVPTTEPVTPVETQPIAPIETSVVTEPITEPVQAENTNTEKDFGIYDKINDLADSPSGTVPVEPLVSGTVPIMPSATIPLNEIMPTMNLNENNIYDLRFAINNVRQAVQNTEKFGFVINVEEFDYENEYQIIIKIDKNK